MMCKDGLLAWQSLNNGTPKVSMKPLGNSVSSLIYPVLQIKEQIWVQIADGSMLILRFSRNLDLQLVEMIQVIFFWFVLFVVDTP